MRRLDYDGRNHVFLQHSGLFLAPVLLCLADIGLVAELGHLLGLGEELLGLVG